MLKVYKPVIDKTDKALPDVFIENIDITGTENEPIYKVMYSISSDSDEWLTNTHLLNNVKLFVFINNNLFFNETLNNLSIIGNKIEGSFIYKATNSSEIIRTIATYCSNYVIIGQGTIEKIDDNISKFGDTKYNFISKIKDLRLLQLNNNISHSNISQINTTKDCFISYNKSKKANIGVVFDIEEFILSKSILYSKIRLINDNLRKEILKTFTVNILNIKFKKKLKSANDNITNIMSAVDFKKLNAESESTKYIFSITDDNSDLTNHGIYDLFLQITATDTVIPFVKNNIINFIDDIRMFLNYYKEEFENVQKNKLIKNHREYFFENIYNNFFTSSNNINEVIKKLIYVYSLFTDSKPVELGKLFTSIFHPLLTSSYHLNYLHNNLNNLNDYVLKIINEKINDTNIKFYDQEFKLNDVIDYNYDNNYGYDVIIQQKYNKNTNEKYQGIKKISLSQYLTRKSSESQKYLINSVNPESIKFMSISTIIAGDISHSFLSDPKDEADQVYKNIYYKLKSNKTRSKVYNENQTIYEQLLENNVSIKQISEGKSESNSLFFKNILFDVDPNSKQSSENTLKSMNLSDLYSFYINDSFIKIDELVKNYLNSNTSVTFKKQEIADLSIDYKDIPVGNNVIYMIFLYNNFFLERLLESGTNYDMYCLEPAVVNSVLNNNLKMYNKYYIVEKNTKTKSSEVVIPNVLSELQNYNIPSALLNRTVSRHRINDILKEI